MTSTFRQTFDEENALESSFRFHRDLESFPDFCRREWRALLFFGLGFTLLVAAVIIFVDESYFYGRVQTDALMYYLKGRAFAETGGTAARFAVNMEPFVYPSMPGILRAPFIRALSNFDDQLRAIQLANVVIIDAVALMSAYMLSWVVPRKWHPTAIAFSFVFALMAPWWMQNVFLPLTDAPYGALSLASVLIAIRIVTSSRPYRGEKTLVIAFALVFTCAFAMRYTEPAVLVLVAALMRGRDSKWDVSRLALSGMLVMVIVSIGVLIALNRETIFGKYLVEISAFFRRGEKQSMFLNLFCLAIPQQIVPAFDLGFSNPPISHLYRGRFAGSSGDVIWSVVGLLLSAVVVAGVWRSRKRLAPEILMLLAVLPVLVVMMPSTPRYLMTYQAFVWIWFFEGTRALAETIPVGLRRRSRNFVLVIVAVALLAGLTLGLKSRGAFSGRRFSASPFDVASYVRGETETYRPLERFLATLPKDRSILVTLNPNLARWQAISRLDYYYADSAVATVAGAKDMYLVLDCGSTDTCETFLRGEKKMVSALAEYGSFSYQPVFEASASKSRAKVFRVRLTADSAAEPAEKQKGNP